MTWDMTRGMHCRYATYLGGATLPALGVPPHVALEYVGIVQGEDEDAARDALRGLCRQLSATAGDSGFR